MFETSEIGFFQKISKKGKYTEIPPCLVDCAIYRLGFKRVSKIRDFVDAISFSKNMDQELFKSGVRMCLRPLVMIL